MNYQTEVSKDKKIVIGHIFKGTEIPVGSKWMSSSGSIVTVEKVVGYPASDHEDHNWYDVHYSWMENGEKKVHNKDYFSFQCRYCLIVE